MTRVDTLTLRMWMDICAHLPGSGVVKLSSSCNKLRCMKLPINWCNSPGQFFKVPTIRRLAECQRYDVKGIRVLRCNDESARQIAEDLPNLDCLHLSNSNISSLAGLQPVICGLRQLHVQVADELMDLEVLSRCEHLKILRISWCEGIESLPPLDSCKQLKEVNLYQCKNLAKVSHLGAEALRKVVIRCSLDITDLSGLRNATKLEHLDISWCENIVDISPVTACLNLTHCYFSNCSALVDLSPLSVLKKVVHIDLSHSGVKDVEPLGKCQELRELKLVGCKNVSELSPLTRCTKLRLLDVSYTTHIEDVSLLDMDKCEVVTSCSAVRITCQADVLQSMRCSIVKPHCYSDVLASRVPLACRNPHQVPCGDPQCTLCPRLDSAIVQPEMSK